MASCQIVWNPNISVDVAVEKSNGKYKVTTKIANGISGSSYYGFSIWVKVKGDDNSAQRLKPTLPSRWDTSNISLGEGVFFVDSAVTLEYYSTDSGCKLYSNHQYYTPIYPERATYTVSYDANGATTKPSAAQCFEGGYIVLPAAVGKSDVQKEGYSITWDINGGTFINEPQKATSKIISYSFNGWKDVPRNRIYSEKINFTPDKSMTLTADFNEKTTSINNTVKLPSITDVTKEDLQTSCSIAINDLVSDKYNVIATGVINYQLKDWSGIEPGSEINISQDSTYIANWVAYGENDFSLTLPDAPNKPNQGNSVNRVYYTTSIPDKNYGNSIPTSTTYREFKYTFLHWRSDKNTFAKANETVTIDKTTGLSQFTAIYDVNIETDNSTKAVVLPTLEDNSGIYAFLGWSEIEQNNGQYQYQGGETIYFDVDSDIVKRLYAVWVAKDNVIKYKTNELNTFNWQTDMVDLTKYNASTNPYVILLALPSDDTHNYGRFKCWHHAYEDTGILKYTLNADGTKKEYLPGEACRNINSQHSNYFIAEWYDTIQEGQKTYNIDKSKINTKADLRQGVLYVYKNGKFYKMQRQYKVEKNKDNNIKYIHEIYELSK